MDQIKVPKIQDIEKKWNHFSQFYSQCDAGPQTFFYTLANILLLNTAQHILEIACGHGQLISFALQLKNPEASYLATDLSPVMVSSAKQRLKNVFDSYESKLSFDEWIDKQKISFQVANGEQKIEVPFKFDRIICNLVLQLTQNPQKMLNSLYQSAENGCLLGLTVWGDRAKNSFFTLIEQARQEAKKPATTDRSNFHLYKKIEDLTVKTGWQTILNWEQNTVLPVLFFDPKNIPLFIKFWISSQDEDVKQLVIKKIDKLVNLQKKALHFACQLMVVRKKVSNDL